MKLAVSIGTGNTLDAKFDGRFGRASGFILWDSEKESSMYIDNSENMNAVHGAGIASAQTVVKAGANLVITGHCGPNAAQVLQSAGVAIVSAPLADPQTGVPLTAGGVIARYNSGALTSTAPPTSPHDSSAPPASPAGPGGGGT